METVVRNIADLDESERSALERLIGHPLGGEEQLRIEVVPKRVGNGDDPAHAGGASLPEWCNVYRGLSDAEVDGLEQAVRRSNASREQS